LEIIVITDQVSQIDNGIIRKDGSLKRNVQANKGSLFRIEFIIMQFPYVDVCAILSDDRINDEAVKTLITKEAQERDVVDPGRLKEAAAFERIRLLRFLYFCDSEISGHGTRMDDLKRLPYKRTIGESNRHPGKIGANIKADREVRRNAVNQ